MFAEGDRVALDLGLLPERNNTRTWKRKDGKKGPRLSKDIYRSSTPPHAEAQDRNLHECDQG
jgi:hypothetical protein